MIENFSEIKLARAATDGLDGAALDLSSPPNQSINQSDQSERFLARLAKSRAAATERVGGSHAAAVVALEAILRRRGVDLARIGARRTPLLERLGEPRTAREFSSSTTSVPSAE